LGGSTLGDVRAPARFVLKNTRAIIAVIGGAGRVSPIALDSARCASVKNSRFAYLAGVRAYQFRRSKSPADRVRPKPSLTEGLSGPRRIGVAALLEIDPGEALEGLRDVWVVNSVRMMWLSQDLAFRSRQRETFQGDRWHGS
jgi:hypothetical protein